MDNLTSLFRDYYRNLGFSSAISILYTQINSLSNPLYYFWLGQVHHTILSMKYPTRLIDDMAMRKNSPLLFSTEIENRISELVEDIKGFKEKYSQEFFEKELLTDERKNHEELFVEIKDDWDKIILKLDEF